MKRSYIFVYSNALGDREAVKGFLNEIPEITHWRYDMPNCFYLVSEADADVLAEKLRALAGAGPRFLIAEIDTSNKQGWITKKSWHLINNREYKPDE